MARKTEPDGLVDALVQSAFTTIAVVGRIAARHDLSLTQGRVLGILRDRRLRMSELAEYLGLERSTLSGLIDRAAARGLLARVPNDADGRVVDVELTDHGAAFTAEIYREIEDALSHMTSSLASAEQENLTQLLRHMLTADAQPSDRPPRTDR